MDECVSTESGNRYGFFFFGVNLSTMTMIVKDEVVYEGTVERGQCHGNGLGYSRTTLIFSCTSPVTLSFWAPLPPLGSAASRRTTTKNKPLYIPDTSSVDSPEAAWPPRLLLLLLPFFNSACFLMKPRTAPETCWTTQRPTWPLNKAIFVALSKNKWGRRNLIFTSNSLQRNHISLTHAPSWNGLFQMCTKYMYISASLFK